MDFTKVIAMVTFTDMVAKSTAAVYPPPAQKTLDLLISFNVPYPGNAVLPPPLDIVRLSLDGVTFTQEETLDNFLSQVYPKLKPNNYGSVGISYSNIVSTDPSTVSGVYNFYTVTGNDCDDIVPPGTAKPLDSAITDLERTYNEYALMFIMDLFYKHKNDIIDNPHDDTGPTLVNLWTDFFQALYDKYVMLVSSPVTLNSFIISKTTSQVQIATLNDYLQPAQALFVVSIEIVNAIILTHNIATDSSIHASLQSMLSAEISLPVPSLYITPELFVSRYKTNTSLNNYYYQQASLKDTFPRINATLFLQATVSLSGSTTVNILQLSSSVTTDNLNILLSYSAQAQMNQCNVIINFNGSSYQSVLNNTSGNIVLALVYQSAGITIYYLDQTGANQTQTITIANFTLDLNQIQVGLQFLDSGLETLQTLAVYPSVLSSAQISLLFETIVP